MQAATPAPGATPPSPRRRGPRPRHSREDVVRAAVAIADSDGLDAVTFRAVAARLGTGVMSLYNYVPDKQALVYDMVELVSAEVALPEPTGDWRADMHLVAGRQRDLAHRHPWMVAAVSHLQPLGPATLAFLEFALGALEPTGLSARDRLETIAMINGFVLYSVRAELAGCAAIPRSRPGSSRCCRNCSPRAGTRGSPRRSRVAANRRRSTRPPTSTG